jgi:hypothetical protein
LFIANGEGGAMKVSMILRPLNFFRRELFFKGNLAEHFQSTEFRALTLEQKRVLYAVFLTSSLFALFVIYWGGLARGPYIDDNILIFSNQHIRDGGSPLTYWYRGQPQTKTWPLTHTAYWFLYQIFGMRFWAYRTLNVLLHWASGVFLFHFLARKVRLSSAAFGACFFWFHPVDVGSVTWISQLSTLGTVLFLGWWMAGLQENDDSPRSGILPLLGMVLAKGFAYLLPVMQLRKRLKTGTVAQAFLFTAPAIAIAAYGLFLAYVGTYHNANERPFVQSYYESGNPVAKPAPQPAVAPPVVPVDAPVQKAAKAKLKKKTVIAKKTKKAVAPMPAPAPVAAAVLPPPLPGSPGLVVLPEVAPNAVPPSYVLTSGLRERVTILGKTSVFYLARFVSFSDLSYPEMRYTDLSEWNVFFLLIGLGVLALLGFALVKDLRVLTIGLLVYLPVSGLFYVPFLKFRLVSDHMVYPAFFVFAWGMGLCVDCIRHKGLRRAYWLWPVLLAVFTVVEVRAERVEFPIEAAIPLHQGSAQ